MTETGGEDRPRRRCSSRCRAGTPCRNSPIRGVEDCRAHAGPDQLRAAARQRLEEARARYVAACEAFPTGPLPEQLRRSLQLQHRTETDHDHLHRLPAALP